MSESNLVKREKREPKPTARYIEMVQIMPKPVQKDFEESESENDLEGAESEVYDSEIENEMPRRIKRRKSKTTSRKLWQQEVKQSN